MTYRARQEKRVVVSGDPGDVRFLTSAQLRRRYGNLSDMALWRWLNDEELAFPKPIVVNRRRLWRESSLDEWDARQAAIQAAE